VIGSCVVVGGAYAFFPPTCRYVTSLETGSQPVTDIFHFVVYDADDNRLDNQMCTITITSAPRQPPTLTVRSGIKVSHAPCHAPPHCEKIRVCEICIFFYTCFLYFVVKVQEGGRVQLSTNHIIVSDLDTPRKDLLVWLVSPPKYGFIENTRRGEVFYTTRGVTPWWLEERMQL